jgi:indole-3-glycerol phosphate synthase
MNILEAIMAERRRAVARARRRVPLAALEAAAAGRRHRSLAARLAGARGTAIIAELKRASPSAGLLRVDYRPARLAAAYAAAGACGLSVLTEPRHFRGSAAHLKAARRATALPVLRKDFMVDPYQAAEAAAWGADVVLLILAALAPAEARALYDAARAYGLEVLAEAHTAAEVDAALALKDAIVGVNSRNLKTLRTDLRTARRLAAAIPRGRLAVAESGIRTRRDIEGLEAAGYRGFLIGESLLAAPDPGAKLRELLGP